MEQQDTIFMKSLASRIAVRHLYETASEVLTVETSTVPLSCMAYHTVSGGSLRESRGVQGLTCRRKI
jgi:hypothetical protein